MNYLEQEIRCKSIYNEIMNCEQEKIQRLTEAVATKNIRQIDILEIITKAHNELMPAIIYCNSTTNLYCLLCEKRYLKSENKKENCFLQFRKTKELIEYATFRYGNAFLRILRGKYIIVLDDVFSEFYKINLKELMINE